MQYEAKLKCEEAMIKKKMIRVLLAGIGTLALIIGIWQGDYQDTLQKAVRICLECIGIG